ncbi:universal stress protein [Pseudomonas sp. N040]|uniref:universal stress protein n=1 Tax=Pseudomonas sp. N040 TaxID=2785325 RepID=UPI0018A29984|nr:universal stress protein [Pseudomonas sp. N040]MBF7730789.1 universal stress protein [Pseudomonas sp. N040]MBW7014432.1 universal stress protein [Pseudomonas sp. N040]
MIRSILYATDLGLYSSYVLQHALALTRAFGARLHVIHAVEPFGLFAESVLQTYLDDDSLQQLRDKGLANVMASIKQRVYESFREELGDAQADLGLIASVNVVQGDPPQVVLDEINRLNAQLLVIGSHSHGAALESSLGRTASRLIQLSVVPVYLIPMLQHRGWMDS